MDNLLNKVITISGFETKTTANNKIMHKLKDQENKSYQVWQTKQDGSETIAYQALKSLANNGVGQTVNITYKEDNGDYQGKPVIYRTIIKIDTQAQETIVNQPIQASPPQNTAEPIYTLPQEKIGEPMGEPEEKPNSQADEIRANVALKMVSEIIAGGKINVDSWEDYANQFYNYKPNKLIENQELQPAYDEVKEEITGNEPYNQPTCK